MQPESSPAGSGAVGELEAELPMTADSMQETAAPTKDSRFRRLRRWYLFWPVLAYLLFRGITLAILAVVDLIIHRGMAVNLGRWDGKWFLMAARNGWPSHLPMVHGHVAGNTIAFFPGFPLTIRWLSDITALSPLQAGVVISGVTGLTAVVTVGLLVREIAGQEKAARATLLFALFPGTFVFSLIYSEGIVITCMALGLLCLIRRRWWVAGLLGLVATATSPVALAFVLSCAWCAGRAAWKDRSARPLIAPVLAPLGFVAYMIWLWQHTGNLNAWRLTEKGGWKSTLSFGYPFHVVGKFLSNPLSPTETGQILIVGMAFTVIGAVLAIRQRQAAPVLIYGLAAGIIAAISSPVGLRPRFVMLAFPLVIAYGTGLKGRPYVAAIVTSTGLLIAMTALELGSWAVFP
jgi:hypothetical protein